MFIREKRIGAYSYLYLVETVRENGSMHPICTQAGGTRLSPADQAVIARRAAFQFHGRRSATLYWRDSPAAGPARRRGKPVDRHY
jgi:hypothetical protein